MSGAKAVAIVPSAEQLARHERQKQQANEVLQYWHMHSKQLQTPSTIEQQLNNIHQKIAMTLDYHAGLSELRALVVEDINQRTAQDKLSHYEDRRTNIEALISEISEQQPVLAEQLKHALHSDSSALDQLVAQALIKIQPIDIKNPTEDQQSLAQQLISEEKKLSFTEWKTTYLQHTTDPRLSQINRHLLELKLLDTQLIATFEKRLQLLSVQSLSYQLLLDSLAIDISQTLCNAREKKSLLLELRFLLTRLKTHKLAKNNSSWIQTLEQLSSTDDLDHIQKQINEANAWLDHEEKQTFIQHSQQAILNAFESLGYVINDEMQTAWAQQGNLVMPKPGTQDYGIELGQINKGGMLMMRTVSLNSARNKQNDLFMENKWCEEFHKLQNYLLKQGTKLSLVRGLAAGSAPLKEMNQSTIQQPRTTKTQQMD